MSLAENDVGKGVLGEQSSFVSKLLARGGRTLGLEQTRAGRQEAQPWLLLAESPS